MGKQTLPGWGWGKTAKKVVFFDREIMKHTVGITNIAVAGKKAVQPEGVDVFSLFNNGGDLPAIVYLLVYRRTWDGPSKHSDGTDL